MFRTPSVREVAGYAVVAAAVWLAWEVVKAPIVERSPTEIAVRLAPSSGEVLRRAAEQELAAKRLHNAWALSGASLESAPFNARALRVRGLAVAELGSEDRADEMLTLAGNWSLRDDPAHGWLIRRRLQQGNYWSAFSHADTLARRREDLRLPNFRLYTVAATQDPRAIGPLTRLLVTSPPWRADYLTFLGSDRSSTPLLATLAVNLEQTSAPLTTPEIQQMYGSWSTSDQIPAARLVRERLNRPPLSDLVVNGDFNGEPQAQIYPFGWRLNVASGMSASFVADDVREGNQALRIEYDGYATGTIVEQLLLLPPGRVILDGEGRTEAPLEDVPLGWSVVCIETGTKIATVQPPGRTDWTRFRMQVVIPASNCTAQWLRLEGVPGDRQSRFGAWFDRITVRRPVVAQESGASNAGS